MRKVKRNSLLFCYRTSVEEEEGLTQRAATPGPSNLIRTALLRNLVLAIVKQRAVQPWAPQT